MAGNISKLLIWLSLISPVALGSSDRSLYVDYLYPNSQTGISVLPSKLITISVPNDTGTGTTLNKLAYIDTFGHAKINPTTNKDGILGVVVSGAGTSGNAQIAIAGTATCIFDGDVHQYGGYVSPSGTVAGDCHDAGITYPTGGFPSIGFATQTRTGAGSATMIPFNMPPAGSGSVSSVALSDGSSSPIYTISGSPVTGSGTLSFSLSTESANLVFAGPTTGSAAQPTFRSLVGADLPNPSSLSLGGIQSAAGVSHQWINSISTLGVPALSQPGFTDISGTASNSQLATMANGTTKCRTTAGTGSPEDCTAAQETALLNAFVGDSGSGGTKGMVPAPATGDSSKYLKGDGTWATVSAGSGTRNWVFVDTGNGYGSTNTDIRRFTNTRDSQGTAITYADSATNGGSFTLSENGLYIACRTDRNSAGVESMGFSLDGVVGTNITSLSYANGFRGFANNAGANTYSSLCSPIAVTSLPGASGVLRAQDNGTMNGTSALVYMFVMKVSD